MRTVTARGRGARAALRPSVVVIVVEAGQPRREPLDRHLEVRVQVDKEPQLLGQPPQGDLLLAAPLREFLDAPIGEVHDVLRKQT
jgi:hypothetical protein